VFSLYENRRSGNVALSRFHALLISCELESETCRQGPGLSLAGAEAAEEDRREPKSRRYSMSRGWWPRNSNLTFIPIKKSPSSIFWSRSMYPGDYCGLVESLGNPWPQNYKSLPKIPENSVFIHYIQMTSRKM